jgi:hypothetical protein
MWNIRIFLRAGLILIIGDETVMSPVLWAAMQKSISYLDGYYVHISVVL